MMLLEVQRVLCFLVELAGGEEMSDGCKQFYAILPDCDSCKSKLHNIDFLGKRALCILLTCIPGHICCTTR